MVDQRVPDNTESWGGVRCEDQDEDDDTGDVFLTIEEQQNLETFVYDSDASESDQVTGTSKQGSSLLFRVTVDCQPLRPTVVFSPLWLATLPKGTRPGPDSETYCGFPCVACHLPKGTQTLDRLHSGLGHVTYLLRGSGGYPQPPEAFDFAPFGLVQLGTNTLLQLKKG